MAARDADCQCPPRDEFLPAGPAATLCHHSSLQTILEVKKALSPLCERMTGVIELNKLFAMPPREGIEYYIKCLTKENAKSLTLHQRAVMTAGFFRDYSILIQFAQVQTLEDLKRNEAA